MPVPPVEQISHATHFDSKGRCSWSSRYGQSGDERNHRGRPSDEAQRTTTDTTPEHRCTVSANRASAPSYFFVAFLLLDFINKQTADCKKMYSVGRLLSRRDYAAFWSPLLSIQCGTTTNSSEQERLVPPVERWTIVDSSVLQCTTL